MKYLFRYLLYSFLTLTFASCSGVEPDDVVGGVDAVPEGILRVFADKTEISADGSDEVTFTVMFGSKDVSNDQTFQLVREYDGEKKYMLYGVNTFSTMTPGTYKFHARYSSEDNYTSDNVVTIDAKPYFSGETRNYMQKMLGVYFTSTGCISCPTATKAIKDLQIANPGVISVVAFHADMDNISDPMSIAETYEFISTLGGVNGYPSFFWNMRKGQSKWPSAEAFNEERASYIPECGVAVEAVHSDVMSGMSRNIKVNVGITSNIQEIYRYIIFVIEDGIVGDQSGESGYIHNNVVRKVLTSSKGDRINDNLPLIPGVEFKVSKEFTLSEGWDMENIRVIAAALVSSDGGYEWVVNNVNECKLGESVSYIYTD